MEKLRIISVGGGWVANTRHIPALLQSGLFDVVGVVSNHKERAESTARRFAIPKYSTEADFSDEWQSNADAVMIGAVPHAHYGIAKAALLAGKHVLVEKPMVVDVCHAGELWGIASNSGLTLAVVHNFQFGRGAQCLRRDLANGRIGEIKTIYGAQLCNHARNIPRWCDDLPLGLFYDEAPHFYYMLRWLVDGELELLDASIYKSGTERNTPRLVSAEYRSTQGIPVFLHINFESSITEWHVTVVGTDGVADVDVWRDIYSFLPNDGVHAARDILRTSVAGVCQHLWGTLTGGLRYLCGHHLYGNDVVVQRFYRAIHGEDCLNGMDAEEGCRVVEMQHELIAKATYR